MARGYFIRKGDKTACGGEVPEADTRIMMFGFAYARQGSSFLWKNNQTYEIVGCASAFASHGRLAADSLDSRSSCPYTAAPLVNNRYI